MLPVKGEEKQTDRYVEGQFRPFSFLSRPKRVYKYSDKWDPKRMLNYFRSLYICLSACPVQQLERQKIRWEGQQ